MFYHSTEKARREALISYMLFIGLVTQPAAKIMLKYYILKNPNSFLLFAKCGPCSWVYSSTQTHWCTRGDQTSTSVPSSTTPCLLPWRRVFPWTRSLTFRLAWLASLHYRHTEPGSVFHMIVDTSNSNFHACRTIIATNEPSPQTLNPCLHSNVEQNNNNVWWFKGNSFTHGY